jgi:hypothetical protein
MAIDSTNINKANNHLSFIAELAELKIPRHMTLEIQVLAWDRYNLSNYVNTRTKCFYKPH